MKNNNNTIILKTIKPTSENVGLIRLTPEAEQVIRRLKKKTGRPFRQIASEIIIQAESLIRIEGDEYEDE